eukprot:SAG22_NODE_38_length_26325_cov_107.302067_10_plen_84_part_00
MSIPWLMGLSAPYLPFAEPMPHLGLIETVPACLSSIVGWVKDFANIAKLMTRLDSGEGDYLFEIESDIMLRRQVCTPDTVHTA